MTDQQVDWVGVRDGAHLLGWVDGAELDGQATMAELSPRPFAAVFGPGTTLKAALDGIVTSQTRVAVVVDAEEGYEGMLFLDDLAEGVTEHTDDADDAERADDVASGETVES